MPVSSVAALLNKPIVPTPWMNRIRPDKGIIFAAQDFLRKSGQYWDKATNEDKIERVIELSEGYASTITGGEAMISENLDEEFTAVVLVHLSKLVRGQLNALGMVPGFGRVSGFCLAIERNFLEKPAGLFFNTNLIQDHNNAMLYQRSMADARE